MRPEPARQIRLLADYLASGNADGRLSDEQRNASADVCRFASRQVAKSAELDRTRTDEFEAVIEALSRSVTESGDSEALLEHVATTRDWLGDSTPTPEDARSFMVGALAELDGYENEELAERHRRLLYSYLTGMYRSHVDVLLDEWDVDD